MALSFVGSRYHGFQIQQNAETVQSAFQRALRSTLGFLPDIKGCSRTDSGVHALRYYISLEQSSLAPDRLKEALNFHLPQDIRVMAAHEAPEGFHARYSCIKKRYIYKIWNRREMDPFYAGRALQFLPRIDCEKLNGVAARFVGQHDFIAMSSLSPDCGEDTVRRVFDTKVVREGDMVVFSVSADGFLYNMVRVMVGTLLSAARGKLESMDVYDIMESGRRTNLCVTAPPEGLYLDDAAFLFDGREVWGRQLEERP